MKKMNVGSLILGSVGMMVLIFDSKTAIAGMRDGLNLCLHTLVPSLFPFFVLSALITGTLMGVPIKFATSICKFCRIPQGSESLLIVGLLGGYPLGAGNIAAERRRGSLSITDAQRMAVFCNNAGPSFLFGILGTQFSSLRWVWLLWIIQIAASLLTGFFLPGGSSKTVVTCRQNQVSLSEAIYQAIRNMAMVCGWIVIFRLILTFLQAYVWNNMPNFIRVALTGLLELSNGCIALSTIRSETQRFLLASIMLSLGGICVWMQTNAVFPELNLLRYILGRMLHCLICVTLSLLTIPILSGGMSFLSLVASFLTGFGVILFLHILRKPKKEVAFYYSMMYNG